MESSAVLLLVYNRPDHARLVLDIIRRAQPARLYISSDGPKQNCHGEKERVDKVREILGALDLDCEVRINYHEKNLGCRIAVSSAIDWFFSHEEEGIVLEDDCLPDMSFFRYCTELLEYYRDDGRIMCISGDNFQQGQSVTDFSYYFSKYNHCWGWATWRRAWSHYDRDMASWPTFRDTGGLQTWSDGSEFFIEYWTNTLNRAAAGKIDSWAYRWMFSCWANNGLTCLPDINLVKNIGFGESATNARSSTDWRGNLAAEEISFPLSHPEHISRNVQADIFSDRVCFAIGENSGSRIKALYHWLTEGIRASYRRAGKL